MRVKISFTLILGILFFSCSKPDNFNKNINLKFEDFDKKETLSGKKHRYDSILNPQKILLKNELLIVSSNGTGNLIHFIGVEGMNYIQSKGVQGDGPGEINSIIWELDQGFKEDTFWAYDLNSKVIHEYELGTNFQKSVRKIKQKQDWFLGFSVHVIAPNKFISNVTRDSYKFGIFDSLGNRTGSFGPWSLTKEVDENAGYLLLGLNQGSIEYNSKNQILAYARARYELIEISNIENGKSVSIFGPKNYEVKYAVFDSNGSPSANVDPSIPRGYSDVFVGNESIFAVHIGKTKASISTSGETSRTIFEFDLNGKPIGHYEVDIPIRSIAVDELKRKIYAITEDKEPGIAVFDY